MSKMICPKAKANTCEYICLYKEPHAHDRECDYSPSPGTCPKCVPVHSAKPKKPKKPKYKMVVRWINAYDSGHIGNVYRTKTQATQISAGEAPYVITQRILIKCPVAARKAK